MTEYADKPSMDIINKSPKVINTLHQRLLQKSTTSIVAQIFGIIAFLISIYYSGHIYDTRLLMFFAVHIIVGVSRSMYGNHFYKHFNADDYSAKSAKEIKRQRVILGWHILATSLLWAIISFHVIFHYHMYGVLFPLTIMLVVGICSVAVNTVGFWPAIFYAYASINLGSIAFAVYLTQPTSVWISFLISLSVYCFTLISVQRTGFKEASSNIYHEHAVSEKNVFMKAMFDAIPAEVYLLDKNDHYTFVNAHFLTSINSGESEIISKSFFDLEKNDLFLKHYKEFKNGNLTHSSFELELINNKMSAWRSINMVKVNLNEVLIMSFNIQELKATLFELEKQKNLVMLSARMASIGEMSGGIAHEINNPLAIVSVSAYQLQKKINDVEMVRPQDLLPSISKITQGVARISGIIKALKSVSTHSSLDNVKSEDAVDIINEALVLIEEKILTKGIRLIKKISSESIMFECYRLQVEQVLINLLSNAYDAIADTDDPWIEIKVHQKNNMVIFSVQNSGPLIPLEIRNKIMTPFFTTKEPGKGTGLGLSICHSFIQQHNGKLVLEPLENYTTFVVEIPLKQMKISVAA